MIEIISDIIKLKPLDSVTKLVFYHVMKFWKNKTHIRFVFKQDNPRDPCTIIDERHEPTCTKYIKDKGRAPNVTMN